MTKLPSKQRQCNFSPLRAPESAKMAFKGDELYFQSYFQPLIKNINIIIKLLFKIKDMKLIYLVWGLQLVAGKKTAKVKQPNNAELDRLNRNRAQVHLDAANRKLQKSGSKTWNNQMTGSNQMNRRTRTNGAMIKPPPIVSCNECVNAGSDEECDQQNRFGFTRN